jgi:arylformamidase
VKPLEPVLHDISPLLSPETAVFPGDTPLDREVVLDLARGDTVTLSSLRSTCHLGAHVDAPSHYDPAGATIGDRPLAPFVGPCRVVRVQVARGGLVTTAMVRAALAADTRSGADGRLEVERVLFATGTYPDPTEFTTDFAALTPDLVDWLAAEGVTLVGVDTPSIDPANSTDLPAHQAVRRHDLNILEGIVLSHVEPGLYELIALPLRLAAFDGSPVRAVLRALGDREAGGGQGPHA